VSSKNYEFPPSVDFSMLLSNPPLAQIFYSAPSSQASSIHVTFSARETKLHGHVRQHI